MEISNDSSIKKPKRLTSVVWNHFERVRKADICYAVCLHCNKKLSGSSNSGTTHLRNHLMRCLKRSNYDVSQLLAAKRMKKDSSGGLANISFDEGQRKDEFKSAIVKYDPDQRRDEVVTIASSKFDQERSRNDLARMIILHGYPLSIVEHVGFKVFVKNVQPLFEVLPNSTIELACMEIYEKEKEKIFETINRLQGRINVSVEMWSSPENMDYLCLTAHYINEDWKLQKKLLNFITLDSSHTDDMLSDVIIKCLMDWDIDCKLFALTFDNFWTNDEIIRRINEHISKKRPLLSNGRLFDVCSAAHTMNAIAEDVIEVLREITQKIRASFKYIRSSQVIQGRFNEMAHQVGITSQKILVPDSPGQWNSTYFMLETAIEYKAAFTFSRWGSGDFRRPPGHGRQGGWHVFSDEYGHGYGPSMSFNNKMLENVSSRPSVSHGDGKYPRNGRESRSFSQRDWKGHSWTTSNGSTNSGGRLQHDLNYDQRSVNDMLIYPSHSHSDFVNSRDKVKGQHDKVDDVNGLGTNQRRDREYSVSSSGWKPLKWTRSGALSSCTSTSGHSSSTRIAGALDSNEAKSEIVLKNAPQNLSPSADSAECAMSSLPYDEATVRKKPRLGWGEGLAKYEKKKVEVPDATAFTNVHAESTHSLNSSLIEKGPRCSGFSDRTSPAPHSFVISGSSPGGDEKSSGKASIDNDVSDLHGSPSSGFENQYEGTSPVEKLNDFSIAKLCAPLIPLLQSSDSISEDSSFMSSTALSKLLIYKKEISKVLETTESEIDLLENELKGLISDSKGYFSFPLASRSFLEGEKYFEEKNDVTNTVATLPVVTSANTISKPMEHSTSDLEEVHADVKGKDRSGRLDVKESVITKENLTISDCSSEDNVVASVDNNMIIKSEGVTLEPVSSDIYEFADEKGDSVLDLILASNKESACKASEALTRLLPANERKLDIWSTNAFSQNQCLVKERFAKRKRLLKFKERVITLKYRAYQSLWKESFHVPPVRKLRAKSQKKYQLSLWTNYSGYQKNRSSIRFRMPSPAGNLNHPVSNAEILKHMSMQLSSSPQIKQYRTTLKMPALILDQKDKMASRFISNNGLVENPCAVEKERAMINPWSSEEKDVFMEKLECFGKDFGKIASFLDHKTTADCIEFYYKNHKSDCFEKTKKLEFGKKVKSTSNYLMTTGKKWNSEANAASLDMLGAAMVRAHKYSSSRSGGRTAYRTTQFDDDLSERAKSFHGFGNEREKVAADVLAGICGSLSSEALGSCVTSNFNRGDGSQDLKCKKGGATTVLRRRITNNVPQCVDDEIFSDESCGEMDPSYWTDGEKSLFIEAVSVYGKNFSMISTHVGSKSTDQCKVFFSKARKCLGLDVLCSAKKMPEDGNGHGVNGGDCEAGVDTKDAFPCKRVSSQMVDDLPKSVTCISGGETESKNLQSIHLEVKESNPSSKTCSNAAVDAMVSDDACNRKDGFLSGFDDDCQSVNSTHDKNGLVLEQRHAVVSDEIAKEQGISALVAALVGNDSNAETKRVSVDTSSDRSDKAHSHTADNSSMPLNAHVSSLSKEEQGCHHVRVHSRSLSDSEQSSRNGDLKLFGQILTHSSSVPSSKSGSSENGNRTELHHKLKCRLKVNSHGNLITAKFDRKNSSGQEEDAPSRSYGFWDGSRMRTGFSSLPDPTTLLSRYPTFDHCSKTASLIEQQPICNGQKSNSNQMSEVNSSKEGIIVGKNCNDDDDEDASDTKLHCNKAAEGGGGS